MSNTLEIDRLKDRLFNDERRKVVNFKCSLNLEGIAAKYGGKVVYDLGVPSYVEMSPDNAAKAREDVARSVNQAMDEIAAGRAEMFEFGDSFDPNREYLTDKAKIRHAFHCRKYGLKSRYEAELEARGVFDVLALTEGGDIEVIDIDNYDYAKLYPNDSKARAEKTA